MPPLPRHAIVTVDKGKPAIIQGLTQVQGGRVIIHESDGAWHNYPLNACVISWDPERQPRNRAH